MINRATVADEITAFQRDFARVEEVLRERSSDKIRSSARS